LQREDQERSFARNEVHRGAPQRALRRQGRRRGRKEHKGIWRRKYGKPARTVHHLPGRRRAEGHQSAVQARQGLHEVRMHTAQGR